MFTCTIVGGGVTQWNGTAFDCTNSNDEILLSHKSFRNPDAVNNSCNLGQITVTSLTVKNNCNSYTSQLSLTTSAALSNKTIRCIHINEENQVVPIGKIVLTVFSGEK